MKSIIDAIKEEMEARDANTKRTEDQNLKAVMFRAENVKKYKAVHELQIIPAFKRVIEDLKQPEANSFAEIIYPPQIEYKIGLNSKDAAEALLIGLLQAGGKELIVYSLPLNDVGAFRINVISRPSKSHSYEDFSLETGMADDVYVFIRDTFLKFREVYYEKKHPEFRG